MAHQAAIQKYRVLYLQVLLLSTPVIRIIFGLYAMILLEIRCRYWRAPLLISGIYLKAIYLKAAVWLMQLQGAPIKTFFFKTIIFMQPEVQTFMVFLIP